VIWDMKMTMKLIKVKVFMWYFPRYPMILLQLNSIYILSSKKSNIY